ncbi:MAG: cytochrome o ubiquinol oxidase subunit IV [Stenotrophobium sp.]
MSAATESHSSRASSHVHGSDHANVDLPHATLRGYMTGFILSIILTIIPFWLVMGHVFANPNSTIMLVLAFGAVQIVVHMVYFLHMNSSSEGGWNMMALIFTLILVVITLSGSIWIMYHMNANMMPEMPATPTPQNVPMMPTMHNMHDMK